MRCTLLFLFILLTSRLLADNVTAEQAHALATDFFKTNVQTRNTSASPQLQLVWDGEDLSTRSTGNLPAFYVLIIPIGKVLLLLPEMMCLCPYWGILLRITLW